MEGGTRPTILINPHAFPSRMTIGQMLESALIGKFYVRNGEQLTISNFDRELTEEPCDSMVRMFDPKTGKPFPTKVFCGIVYYHRLKHMVGSKIRARGFDGRKDPLTGQAVRGRKQYGGLRVGEMETWVLRAQGADSLLRDLFLESGDGLSATYCAMCNRWDGVCFQKDVKSTVPVRPFCGPEHVQHHRHYPKVARATLLMWDELAAVGVQMAFGA